MRGIVIVLLALFVLAGLGESRSARAETGVVQERGEQPDRRNRASRSQQRGARDAIHQFSLRWMKLRDGQRRAIAGSLLAFVDSGRFDRDVDPAARAFVRAMLQSMAVRERRRLLRGNWQQRMRRWVRLLHRYAGHVRLVHRLPSDLGKMVAAQKVSKNERNEILGIADARTRVKAFLRLRETVLLRELLADRRIDDATFRRIVDLPSGARRSRALNALRQDVFRRVNLHLLHTFLSDDELRELAAATRPLKAIRTVELKHRIRFLRIMPSSKESDLSRCLRLSETEEKALAKASAQERAALLQTIFVRQRGALIALLESMDSSRARFQLRRVRSVESPQEFYRRALRLAAR